jgi:orotate phosphoribosyltransferase
MSKRAAAAIALTALEEVGAILTNDHFVLTSGNHSRSYVNKDALTRHPAQTELIAELLAVIVNRHEIIVSPAYGAIVLGQRVAYHTGSLFIFAEKAEDETFLIKRGNQLLLPEKSICIVEDILTTGSSVQKVVDLVSTLGGDVTTVLALCNRGGVTAEAIGVPKLRVLLDLPMETYTEEECPLCKAGIPVNITVGKGREYMERQQRPTQ